MLVQLFSIPLFFSAVQGDWKIPRSPIFSMTTWSWCSQSLHVLAVNAWRLESKHKGIKTPYLSFLQNLVIELMEDNGTPRAVGRGNIKLVATSQRFDGMHIGLHSECTLNGNKDIKTNCICSKCEIPLHIPLCFQASIFVLMWFWVQIFSGSTHYHHPFPLTNSGCNLFYNFYIFFHFYIKEKEKNNMAWKSIKCTVCSSSWGV